MPSARCPARVRDFRPPHCPHRGCPAHHVESGGFRFHRRGYRRIGRAPGWVRVFRCLECGGYFCDAAFSNDYWKKRAGQLARVYVGLANGQAERQLARCLGVSKSEVANRQRVLARQCKLLQDRYDRALAGRLDEPVALDGFRTYAGSQYEPLDLNTTVTTSSGFALDWQIAPLRRSGEMTAAQRRIRAERDARLGRPAPQVRMERVVATLMRLARLVAPERSLVLRTDLEPDYVRAVDRASILQKIEHETVSSRVRRDTRNPLWMINHKHRLSRHSLKSHVRETIAAHKRVAGLVDRALILRTYLNVTKGCSERSADGARTTPAMKLGLERHPLHGDELFARRLFPEREGLAEEDRLVYEGRVTARPHETMTRRVPVYAY